MEVELLKKALAREKLARKEAENIGETRSAELYSFNQQLQELIMTTNLFLGITTSIFFKLWSFAPFIMMFSLGFTVEISVFMYQKI